MSSAVRFGEVSAEDTALVRRLQSALARVERLSALPAAIAAALADRVALVRVSLRAQIEGTNNVEMLAVWTADPTNLGSGLRMPSRAMSFDAVMSGAQEIVANDVQPADGLMHDILYAEGVRAYVSLPLVVADVPVAVLSLSAGTRKAFESVDSSLLSAIAQVVSERYAALSPR